MKIETKFGLGQVVYVKAKDRVETRTERKCPGCEGSGMIELKDTTHYICPKCHGTRRIEIVVFSYKAEKRTVGEIRIAKRSITCSGVLNEEVKVITMYVMRPKSARRAFYNEEGFQECDIFATKKEADEKMAALAARENKQEAK